jgi:hypothetical protein
MDLAQLETPGAGESPQPVVLAVYAPFGTDAALSQFPDGASTDLALHPLMKNLEEVAKHGVHVLALIDLDGKDTFLVRIAAGSPADVVSRWKQDMTSPLTLAGLLHHASEWRPGAAIVLALEGHGAGYLPDLDRRALTARNVTDNGRFEWRMNEDESWPVLPGGFPGLPGGFPGLPGGFPGLPTNHMPMSTFGIGDALARSHRMGAPKPAVIHLNNCFNMSVELLHTIAPHAHYATGYINYNFFTAGGSYPEVFERLQAAGSASAHDLAIWFAQGNRRMLEDKGNHPTVGCVVELARMKPISEALDDLADALLAALRTSDPVERARTVDKIKQAIVRAQQLDVDGNMVLETPDEMTDLLSFSVELSRQDYAPHPVAAKAAALAAELADIKVYGSSDRPWTRPSQFWDFSSEALAMNILLPDPLREGRWDWRSPYYLDVNPDPTRPRVQPNIIDFLQVTDWVDFLIEYHKDVRFVGLLTARIPEFPVFNATFKLPPGDVPDPCKPRTPGRRRKGG